jgi:23S rRNA (uracil1939-C5)-methyltransferase
VRRPASRRSAEAQATTVVTVARIGADGDGVASLPDGTPLYIPLTLPGERVRARPETPRGTGWRAAAEEIEAPSPDRVTPPCPHFGACGGCALQLWADDAYAEWKAGLLRQALVRAGYETPELAPLARTPPHARRRMEFAVRRTADGAAMGLHRAGTHEVIDLRACTVLDPAVFVLADALRDVLARCDLLRREASVTLNRVDRGCDVLVRSDAAPSVADRMRLAAFADAHDVPRISWALRDGETETVCLRRPPVLTLSGVAVVPPPGGFLQASAEGEAAIAAAVLDGLPARLPARARVAELYAGAGTLTFALAARARVIAYEGDAPAAEALRQAARTAGLAGRVEVETRDLVRRPLLATDLAGLEAVVLDPPFAGAAAQMGLIAASGVPCVIIVSCNPAALARDAGVLRAAGYALVRATPIDQFLWSARLEAVAVFRRESSRRSRSGLSRWDS